MSDHRWVRVTQVENLPMREGRAVMLGGRAIALFNLGDKVLATDNHCPHEGGPLCDGIVTGESVVCPLHAWKVNLESGRVERPTQGKDHCVTTYPTRIEDGVVVIGFPIVIGTRRDGPSGPSPARNAGELTADGAGEGAAA
jgi:nitrite reductase (NADH) small subunit